MLITYLKGDATSPIGLRTSHKFIVHCCNDIGGFGSGFALSLTNRWPEVKEAYLGWYELQRYIRSGETIPFKQGQIQVVPVGHGISVVNLIGQSGMGSFYGLPPVRYGAIHEGLIRLREHILLLYNDGEASVHMPRMGCDRAGGEWGRIEEILEFVFYNSTIPLFVYDFKPSKK